MDARSVRTRTALADALIALAPEKGFLALSVEDLARAAKIGRSTFYSHYADKADFLNRSYADLLNRANAAVIAAKCDWLLPMQPILSHMSDARGFVRALQASGEYDRLLARREADLRAIAEQNLARLHPGLEPAPRKEAAIMLAGAYSTLLRWWLANDFEPSPSEMQAWFNRYAEAAIATAGRSASG